MAVIACVFDDAAQSARLARILASRPDTRVVQVECDSDSAQRSLNGKVLTAAVFCPMEFPRFLEMRSVVYACGGTVVRPRIVIAQQRLDSAYVYRALAFGADDIVDIGRDDDHVVKAFDIVLSGRRRAYELYLVPAVDAQVDITLLRIEYADDIDRQIVPMVVAGYTDREIADVLYFSHQAVRNRISRLLMRSGIRNRTQLASTFLLGRLCIAPPQEPEGEIQP